MRDNEGRSGMAELLNTLGRVVAVILILRWAALIVETYCPFLPTEGIVPDIIRYVDLYAPMALMITVGWYIKSKDQNDIHYGYEYSKTINKKHNLFLKEIIDIVTQRKLDQFTYQRLILAAEYFANLHKLLSVYHNNEVTKNTKRKTRQ